MTRMSSTVTSDSASPKNDLMPSERHSENAVDDVCHFIGSTMKRKAEGKCGSPTSSKDSHSDRDSDYEDSNSEHHGMYVVQMSITYEVH